MTRYRLSGPATADIARILRKNEAQHGPDARVRYRRLLATAMRRIAADPAGPSTSGRSDVLVGIRSFHIRHSRQESREAPVHDPVHVIFYRAVEPASSKSCACCMIGWSRAVMWVRRTKAPKRAVTDADPARVGESRRS